MRIEFTGDYDKDEEPQDSIEDKLTHVVVSAEVVKMPWWKRLWQSFLGLFRPD